MTHYINGEWVESGGDKFFSKNPATQEIVFEGKQAEKKEIIEAFNAAEAAFAEWSFTPLSKRIEILLQFQECVIKNEKEISEAISQEMGKPLWDSLGETRSVINKITLSIEAYKERTYEVINQKSSIPLATRHKPHGVIAVFGPYNFPAHLPHGHIIPALLAGNTVIFKPSEKTPRVAKLLLKLWQKTELPRGVLNLVQGGKETGRLLASHPDINGLFFTGSYATGKTLSQYFGFYPEKILSLEMGGNNPLIVWDIENIKAAVYHTLNSAFITSGQRCTAARRLIIPNNKLGEHFLDALIVAANKLTVGAYNDDIEPFMGPLVSQGSVDSLFLAETSLLSQGASALLPLSLKVPNSLFLKPGIIDVTPLRVRPDEEFFGPFLQVIRVDSFKDALKEGRNTKFGLSAALLSDNSALYEPFYKSAKAGIVNWNTPTTGASSHAPFGGIGCSGNNRPGAYYAADFCAYPVASYENDKLTLPNQLNPGIYL